MIYKIDIKAFYARYDICPPTPALSVTYNELDTPLGCVTKLNKSPAVVALLGKLATAYKHGHVSGLIRHCGAPPILQALVMRSTDDLPLLVLCQCDSWEAASARIETIPAQAAIEEMHEKDENGRTAFATAVADAQIELLESMVELGKQDTKERRIVGVRDKIGCAPLYLAAIHRTDTATIKLLARENPASLYGALPCALKHNKKSTAVVSLQRKYLAAWDHGNIAALIDLCGESDVLMEQKEYVEKHPVHFAAGRATDIAIIKPVIREHATELLTEDENGETPLDRAKINQYPAVPPFVAEVVTAFHNGNYPVLIKLCGSTPDWTIRAKLAKDKKDREDAAEADRLEEVFFDWDENGIKENSASQPTPPTTKKKHKKKRKTAAEKAAEVEAAQAIRLAEIRAVLAAAEPYAPTPAATEEELETAVQALE